MFNIEEFKSFFSEKTKQKINEFVEETIASINVVSLISKGNAFPIKSSQDEKNNMKTFLYYLGLLFGKFTLF